MARHHGRCLGLPCGALRRTGMPRNTYRTDGCCQHLGDWTDILAERVHPPLFCNDQSYSYPASAVPPIAKVTFTGTLPPGVSGKDVITALCGLFESDVLNHAVEFAGTEETLASLPIDSRMTISNMACEWGALTALFPVDRTLERWLRDRATKAAKASNQTSPHRITHERIDELLANPVTGDHDAAYAKHLYMDLSTLSPHVSGPNSVKVMTPLNKLAQQNIKINRAYIVSCTASRASDLASAAKVFRDAAEANNGIVPRIADGVQLYIAAASAPEQEVAEKAGDWQILLDAGAHQLPPGCGPCIGLGTVRPFSSHQTILRVRQLTRILGTHGTW